MSHKVTLAKAISTVRATAAKMERDGRFKVRFAEYPNLGEEDLTAWEQWIQRQPDMAHYRIPNDLRMVYSECGGFVFQWQYLASKGKIVTGSAELVTILSLYQRDDETDKPVSAIYENPRPFDVISDDEYVGIKFSRNDSIALAYIDNENKAMKTLTLNPVEYIRMLAEFRAAYGWQALFVEDNLSASASRKVMKKQLKMLFGNRQDRP